MSGMTLLRADRFNADALLLRQAPFPLMIASDVLVPEQRERLLADFPRFRQAGYLPYDPAECGPSVRQLVDELTSEEFADAVGEKLSITHLGQYPTLVTLSRALKKKHGNIHTDSRSKIATALLYLNPEWTGHEGGCLRFLNSADNYEDMAAPEIKPVYGNFAMFRRRDNSYHGHLPYEGERLVIQVAWLTSEEEKLRKTKRGLTSRWLKGLFGRADRDKDRDRAADSLR